MSKIKVYLSEDEYNKIHYYEYFTIVDGAYSVGDLYDGEEIKEIHELRPDCENNFEVFYYKYYQLITTMNKEYDEEERLIAYIAVRKADAPEGV